MIKTVELFGKTIDLKTHTCSFFGEPAEEIEEPYVNLYIRTKFCNAKCEFCTYAEDASKYDESRFIEVLEEISSKIKIRKIAVSGGEPTLYWDNFKSITLLAKKYAPDAELSMNTDGLRWLQLFNDPIYKLYDYIQLSRHHYDDTINNGIFKTNTPTSDEIRITSELQTHPRQIQFRCNLIKGFVDDKEQVFKYLDWANSVGINDVGLVSLMPINKYSEDNFIHFHIKELLGENFKLTKQWERYGGGCECFNYVYLPEDLRIPMKVYHKNTFMPSLVKETLVFDGQNLRMGFDTKDEIIF
jgi:pyruvate-formate lyase-activating enzyme